MDNPSFAGRSPARWRRAIGAMMIGLGVAAACAAPADAWAKPGDNKKAPAAGKGGKDARGPKGKGDAPAKKGDKGKAAKAAPAPEPAKPAETVKDPATPLELKLPIERYTLANGLRVVLNPDHTSPTVAITVTYDVGSRNEEKGRSGFAHLFEHMMFQGSKNVAKGEHFRLVSGHGGVLNGTTNSDRTNYFEVLPSNELALGLWLEADRMKTLDVSEANFENQRKVVQEEYRMRVSNVAYVPSMIRLEELVFQGYWPYEHSTIGSMADLDAAKLDWVIDFHKRYYGPNNAVLTISGDFEAGEAKALVEKYFGAAQKVDVKIYADPAFPEQTSQRTAVVKDDNARTPGVLYGWAIPPTRHADHYALEMASLVLGYGESSRLHQLLVRDKSWAQGVAAGTEDRRGPDMFSVDAKLAEGAKVGDVEKLIEGEVKKLGATGPTDAELEKVRRQVQAGFVLGLQSNMARSKKLGEYEAYFGDARLLNDELPKYLAVTRDDVKRVVTQYLGPTRRTIVETYPTAEEPKAETAAPKADAAAKADVKPAVHKDAKADVKKTKGSAASAAKKGGAAKDAKPKKKK